MGNLWETFFLILQTLWKKIPLNILIDNGFNLYTFKLQISQRVIKDRRQNSNTKWLRMSTLWCKQSRIQLHGILKYNLLLGNTEFDTSFLIYSINIDAILGHNFWLQQVKIKATRNKPYLPVTKNKKLNWRTGKCKM